MPLWAIVLRVSVYSVVFSVVVGRPDWALGFCVPGAIACLLSE